MPIDASIYSQVRPVTQQEGPLDQYTKMISLKSLMGNEQLNEMQRTKLARDLKEEEDFKALFAGATPDQMNAPDFYQRALGTSPTRAIAMQKSLVEQQKAQAELFKTKLETGAKALELHRDQLTNINDPQAAAQWVKAAYDDPTLRPIAEHGGTLEQALARIPTDPQAFADWKMKSSVGAAKLLEMAHQKDVLTETQRHNRATETASERANRLAQANLQVKGAEATPGGVFSIPDIVARATGGQGSQAPAAGTMTPGQVLNGGVNALPAAPAATGQPTQPQPAAAPRPAAPPTNPVQAAIASGKTGDELIKMLPPEVGNVLKQMIEGRMAPPTSFALSKPYWQGMMALATQADPNFDETLWKSRNSTRTAFASGAEAKNLTKINTAIGHLDSFDKAAQSLGNGDYPMFNRIWNSVAPEVGGTKTAGNIRTFQQAKEAVANELMSVFRGVGASSGDTAKWAETLNASDSPEALRAAVKGAVELLDSRIGALTEQYRKGMSTSNDVDLLNMVYPKAKATLERLRAGKDEGGKQTATGQIGNGQGTGGIKFLGWEKP